MSERKVLSEEQGKDFLDAWLSDPEVQYEVGYSTGSYHATDMALNAIKAGEIDEYVEWMTPKSMEAWKAIEEKYGKNYSDRWRGYAEEAYDANRGMNGDKSNSPENKETPLPHFEQLELF